jgi:shikimate 5-dehydrogenase
MFIEQARAQFEFWTGTAAPAGLYERVVREALTS